MTTDEHGPIFSTRPDQYLAQMDRKLSNEIRQALRTPWGTPAERAEEAVVMIRAHLAHTEKFTTAESDEE